MLRSKPVVSSADTPDDALKRNKLQFNSVIEKFIAMAHGLPPPRDSCSFQSWTKHSPTAHPRKQRASTGRITKANTLLTSNSLRRASSHVPHSPSSSIEEDIFQEVEESLRRRKEELGLGDDHVLQEVVEHDPGYHPRKKGAACNILNASQRRKSHSDLRRQDDECHGESSSNSGTTARALKLVDENRLPKKKGRKKKEMNSLSDQDTNSSTRKSSSESSKNIDRKKLEDLTNSGKHRALGQTKSPKKRVRKKMKDLDSDGKLRSSDECKTPRKRGRKKKENLNNDNKLTPDGENRSPKKRGRKKKENLNNDSKLTPSDENRSPKKRGRKKMKDLDNDDRPSSSNKSKSPKKRGRKRKENLNSDISLTLIDENKSPKKKGRTRTKESPNTRKRQRSTKESPSTRKSQRRTTESPNTKKSQPARTKTPVKQVKVKKSTRQHGEEVQAQSIDNNTETASNKHLTEEGKVEEKEQEFPLISDAIRKAVQHNVGSSARIIHIVQAGENVFCLLDIFDTLHLTISQENETELEQQTVRKQTDEEETAIVLEQQTTRRQTDEDETDTLLEQQMVRMHTDKERKLETELQQPTLRTHTNIEKEVNTEKEQQISRMHTSKEKHAEKDEQTVIRHTSNKEPDAEPEKIVRTHVNKEKKTDTGKLQRITANANKEMDTQQQRKQTLRKTKPLSKAVSEVSGNALAKRKARTTRVESSEPQKVLLPVPIANHRSLRKSRQTLRPGSESHDSPKVTPRKRVTRSSVCGRVPEVANSAKDSTPSPPQQDHSQSDVQVSERCSLSTDSKAGLSNSETGNMDHSVNGIETVVHNGNLSNSSPGLPCEPTRENLWRKRKFDLFSKPDSEEEDNEWSTASVEDGTIEELNVKKRKRNSFPYRLPGSQNKRKPNKSSHTVNDDDDDGIMLLNSTMPTPVNKENDPDVANNMNEKHNQPSTSHSSPKKPTQVNGHLLEKRATGGHHRNLTNSSFSQSLANSFIARHQQGRVMAAAQSREEDLDLGDTWTLLRIPPLQQSSSLLTSGIGISQGSQPMETTSLRHQVTTSTTSSSGKMATTVSNTTANCTPVTNTSAAKVSKPMKRFWAVDSDEEAENGNLTTGFLSRSTIQSIAFTSASQLSPEKSPPLPDYSTLGPERWMAAVKAMQKNKKTSSLKFSLL